MIEVTQKDPGAIRRLFDAMRRCYRDNPEQLADAVSKWWWAECDKVFMSKGGHIGKTWAPLSKSYREQKKGAKDFPNLDTGALAAGMRGGAGSWKKLNQRNPGKWLRVGLRYKDKRWYFLDSLRPLVGAKANQMAELDKAHIAPAIKKIDQALQNKVPTWAVQ